MHDNIRVYVVYPDWGEYEGCREPVAVFLTKEKAALFIFETTEHWKQNAKIIELWLEHPNNLSK